MENLSLVVLILLLHNRGWVILAELNCPHKKQQQQYVTLARYVYISNPSKVLSMSKTLIGTLPSVRDVHSQPADSISSPSLVVNKTVCMCCHMLMVHAIAMCTVHVITMIQYSLKMYTETHYWYIYLFVEYISGSMQGSSIGKW